MKTGDCRKGLKHLFTAIAAEAGFDSPERLMWKWCIYCGSLRLGKNIYKPGVHQHMVIQPEKRKKA